jgi:hypothetical protein
MIFLPKLCAYRCTRLTEIPSGKDKQDYRIIYFRGPYIAGVRKGQYEAVVGMPGAISTLEVFFRDNAFFVSTDAIASLQFLEYAADHLPGGDQNMGGQTYGIGHDI